MKPIKSFQENLPYNFLRQNQKIQESMDSIIHYVDQQMFWNTLGARDIFNKMIQLLKLRKTPLTFDITGYCLEPTTFMLLNKIDKVKLIDTNRKSTWDFIMEVAEKIDHYTDKLNGLINDEGVFVFDDFESLSSRLRATREEENDGLDSFTLEDLMRHLTK